jgi:hypothetical protein
MHALAVAHVQAVVLLTLSLKVLLNTRLMLTSAVTVAHVLQVALLTLSLKANLYIIKIKPSESTPLQFAVKVFFRPFLLDKIKEIIKIFLKG